MSLEIKHLEPELPEGDYHGVISDPQTDRNWDFGCLVAHGVSEFIATMTLFAAIFGCIALVIVPNVPPGPVRALAVGVLVAVSVASLIYSPLGKLSGAHMNPAISFAFWLEGRLKTREMITYALMQFSGAVVACAMLNYWLYDPFKEIGFAVLAPAPHLSKTGLILMEACATAALVVILFFMMSHKNLTRYTGLALSVYLLLVVSILFSLTGGSLNPAGAYGAALVAQKLQGQWPYFIAPFLGSGFGVLLYRIAPRLPRPKFHRLHHCHEYENYTRHILERVM